MSVSSLRTNGRDISHFQGKAGGGVFGWLHDRPARVTGLVLGICLLGVYDLLHTLMYMQTIGMVEMNPLARFMLRTGGVQQLVLFKLFTIALSCGILYCLRRTKPAEVCAAIGFLVMVGLTVYWFMYNGHVVQLAEGWEFAAQRHDPRWVLVN